MGFKKLLGALIETGESGKSNPDVDALLADIGGAKPAPAPIQGFDALGTGTVPTPAAPTRSALDWTIDEVLAAGHVSTTRESATTVLALLDGLKAFPPAQQLAMVRAMDAADDTWSEAGVLVDAQKRLAVLQQFGAFIDRDANAQVEAANTELTNAVATCDQKTRDLDQQITTLQAQRQQVMQESANAKAQTDAKLQAIRDKANVARQRATEAAGRYKALVNFFGASVGTPGAQP